MKRGILLIVAAVVLLGTVGGGVVSAQNVATVNIPFQFTVNHKVMMPGTYEINVTDAAVINVVPQKGAAVLVPTITRLAQRDKPMAEAEIVFDVVGDQHYLSEVWLPTEDGYLVTDTKQVHQHRIVKGKKKA